MAHSVAEAAARAVKNSQRVQVETRTPEQRLSDIRKNRAAKLFITPDDQDFLLMQYDFRGEQIRQFTITRDEADTYIAELEAKLEEFRTVYEEENRSMALKIERVVEGEA